MNKGDELRRAGRIRTYLNAAAFITIASAMLLAEFTAIPDFLSILLGVIGGVMLSIPGYIRIAIASWLHVVPHVDEKSLKSRLDLVRYK